MFRYGWLYSATAYNHAYTDCGLFSIHASAEPQYLRDMIKVIIYEISNMANNIQREELTVCIISIFKTFLNYTDYVLLYSYREQRNNYSLYY